MIVSQLKWDVLWGSVDFLVSDVNNGDYCRAELADRDSEKECDVSSIPNTQHYSIMLSILYQRLWNA